MILRKCWWLIFFLYCNFCAGWLDERPILESINGNLYISNAKDKNITLKITGSGNINVNDINLLHALWAAKDASKLIEKWKLGVLDDVETTLHRLTRIIEGPNGLVRKLNSIEYASDSILNTSNRSSTQTEANVNTVTSAQVRTINNRLRRLENKVRTISKKLRLNECASDPCQNGGTCIDQYDSFYCQCLPEWEGSLCTTDVNECERFSGKPSGCQNGATCVNLPGSFSCICAPGWHGFHCSTQQSICDKTNDVELCGNGICVKTNTPLGYTCICKSGWEHVGENDPSCRKDIDECTTARYPCSVNPLVVCHNVPGTFYCGVCPPGYSGDGFKCQDIDECLTNNGGCSTMPFVECINTLGSRKCGACPQGYQGDGITCFYIGRCTINNGGCHNLATCKEGPSSEVFCLCPEGYQGNGKGPEGCKPMVNACANNPCIHGICSLQGSNGFFCTCNEGYTGQICNVPVDPCTPNPCQNNGTCRLTNHGKRLCECTASFTGPTCSTPKSSCGGFYKSSFGYVEFPVGKGNKYDNNLSCAWVILTNHSMILNVTFTRFALENSRDSDECKHDYVQIHDGRSAGSYIIGKYCGNHLPNNGTIISTHNSLYIWFHSDNTVNNNGFAFNWTTIEPVCGGDINEEYGSISSPGYPGKYPTNRDCYWNINVLPGKKIVLHFISLMLEEHPSCQYDYLEINETTYIGQHQLGLLCNHSKPSPIITSGPHAMIHFHSDNSGTDNGFHLSFLSIAASPDCGGIHTSESGEIISPGYHTGNYRPDMICEWEIRLPKDSHVRIMWLDFDIELSRNCMFDSVQIYQGLDINSPLVGRYCGSSVPSPISIKSNKVLVRFESDTNLEEKGFILKYEVECGGTFTESSGIIKSPFYPNFYPASKDCIYLISQPLGKAIVLTFEFLDIEEGSTIENQTECYFDRLEIRDGDTNNSTLLRTLCGSMHDMPNEPIYSTHNYMFLEFFTDASIYNHGFKANYTTIDRECGGIFRDAPGEINMPGTKGKWNYNMDCLWSIHAPANHAIQLTWFTFPTFQSSVIEECGQNFIELIENFGTADAKSLGKYCPVKPPPKIITSLGNDLTLHYNFTGDISDINYRATFVFINDSFNCGGHYYAETGYIRSPNYPEKYPKNKECVWIIEAKNKYLVTLSFKEFQLEKSPKCSYDYLEIRSGSQENSPLLGKYCGSQVENDISSMTNQIYIKFVSDSSLQNQGFEIHWSSTKAGCGGNLQASSGAIISPNYPQNYFHRATCTWNIRVSAGSVVRITFVDFDIEDHVKCGFDFLEISDLINGYAQNTQRFCGSTSPPLLLSKSNQIKLIFRSDLMTNSRGFYLRYQTECNNKITGFQGVIESPNFPQDYENLSNCSWTISVPPGNKINITFSHFDIQKSSNGTCQRDYIKVQEGDNDEPNTEILTKCGSEDEVLPLKIFSSQRQIFISFISDRYGVASGFRLEWYVDGCSKHFTKASGEFTSPGYPHGNKFPNSLVQCMWLIEVDFDKSIEIIFPKIENTKTRTCYNDLDGAIKIYNGNNENAPLLVDMLCYSDVPVTFTSSGNQMLIKYSSEVNYASRGFTAAYHSVGILCGGKFTGQSGVIHSTNYPKNYPHNQYCEWLITVDSNHLINLTFVDLDLEKSRNCSDDYIKIFDGNATEAPILGTHCQSSDVLPYYVSSGNQMLVTMRTDLLVSAKGFKAYYNRTCGARILVNDEGVLRSSPTLHTMSFLNCTWILVAADSGDKISLTFNQINLIETEDCSTNHIEIYDGEGINGLLLGTLCANKIPTPFFSTGNAITVHLTSKYGQLAGDNFDAMYSTFTDACGGKYLAETGVIASPNYPTGYPSKADCIWILNSSPGNRISLSFEDFQLLNSENCDIDYLEVREKSGIGKLRGIFCGDNVESITSSQSLWLRFKSASDTIGNPKGFKAEYHLLFGDELTGDYGEIASPMYPIPIRKSEAFSWRVTVDFNYVIQITFLDFYFDSYEDYCYSSLKFYDGFNDEAPQMKELCGISVPSEPIISSSNVIFIEMENSFDNFGNRFHLKWIKIPRQTVQEQVEEMQNSENQLIILSEQNKTHIFNSPGYPYGYENNLKYTWTFVSPVGTHLVLRFIELKIEEAENCIADYVAIYKGYITNFESEENLIKKVCLSNSTRMSFPSTNVMTVQFVSDSYHNESGFSAIVLTECGGIIEKTSGSIEIKYKNEPGYYILSCEWVIKVRSGRRINVKVIKNNIEDRQSKMEDNSCRSNYLMLKNGESSSSPLLGTGKYCNGVIPPIQNTSSNHLYVKLAVYYSTVNFKLVFKELGHDCGGRFILSTKTDSQQIISSPNYPNIPTPHTECFWTFMSLDEHRLAIHFVDRFDLAFSQNCEKEYIEIRDGGTDASPLLGRYCRNMPPSSLSTKGNLMYVHYFTDLPEPRNGFKALITTSDVCGGIERNSYGGTITSPNYPEPYDTKSYYCNWWIVAPSSNRGIKIQFQDLELPSRRNCTDTDHVTIYEKLPGNFSILDTEIGTYCGKNKPEVIEILTSEATVIFNSSFTNTRLPSARGFRLNYTFDYNGCGGSLTGMEGKFQTTGYPRPTPHRYCNWRISVPEGFQVVVDILDLDLGEVGYNRYTATGHVSFHHDPNSIATIAVLRNTTDSMRIASSSNFMSIYYISIGGYRGMKAVYFARSPAPCGNKFTDWENSFSSPPAPFNESSYYCKWIIKKPKFMDVTYEDPLTLSIKVSGLINKGEGSITCSNRLNYIWIKGEETVARICGNLTKDSISIASPFKTYSIEAINASRSAVVNFNVEYKWHKCGGILTGTSNILKTPQNVSYPVHCAWKVKQSDIEDTILITFKKMNLGPCDKAYVQVHGKTYMSPSLGKFCGNKIPQDIISPANKITIEYYAIENTGEFEVHLNAVKNSCGGTIKRKTSEISSPGFPKYYPNNTECIWKIISNPGYHLSLSFVERFNLETSQNCTNDFVEIYEWKEKKQNNTDHWKSLGRICGRVPPEKSFNTTSNIMKVKFTSNDKIEGEGFKAVWHSNCGGVYEVTETPKYIVSPRSSLYYSPNLFCNYTLIAAKNQEIVVDFMYFSLEGKSAYTCSYDNLTIVFFSDDWIRGTNTWCGVDTPGKKISRGRMQIIFKTDNSVNREGFKFKYHLNDCGGIVTTPRVINPVIDNDPDSYASMNCIWVAKAPAKKSVLVRFEEFNISQPLGSCISNYVRIYEGNTTDTVKQKATFCGNLNNNLPIIQSNSNIMTIQFYTGFYGVKDNSFKAAVFFVNSPAEGCGGNINVTNISQFKTQIGENYDSLQDCHWQISSPQGYNIQFTIEEIDLKITTYNNTVIDKQMMCNSDYIEIRDGGPYAELIGHYCGSQVPPPIISTSNSLWIRFVSDGINQGRGVKGSLKAILTPCGITDLSVKNNSQILTSPDYNNDNLVDITCRWVIHGNNNGYKRVRLTFEEFNLEDSKLCENEYLKIADLDNRDFISEGFGEQLIIEGSNTRHPNIIIASQVPQSFYKYCGSELPHDYFSNYKDVEIIYKATKSHKQVNKKGFKLAYSKAACSRNYTELQGRIIHDDITDCWVTIQVPENYTINMYFNHFFLPGSTDCSKAYMQIREGEFDGRIIQTVCNYETPNPVFSEKNRISIHTFASKEETYHNNLYDITYTSTNKGKGCGGILYNYGGVITSPLYPNPYRNRSTCTWDISVPRGMKVSLHFSIFDIGPKNMCDSDYLFISEIQSNGDEDQIITYCGGDTPADFNSQNNRIIVTYITSVNNGGSGWVAYFAAL